MSLRQSQHVLLEAIRHQHEHLRIFVEQQHDAHVAEALVGEARRGYKLQALHLAEVRGVAQHMDVQQLRQVVVAHIGIVVLERRADHGALFLEQRAFVGQRLAGPHTLDERAQIVETRARHQAAKARVQRSHLLLLLEERRHIVPRRGGESWRRAAAMALIARDNEGPASTLVGGLG